MGNISGFDQFKEEYGKKEFKVGVCNFSITKIPARQSAKLFRSLLSVFLGDIDKVDLTNNKAAVLTVLTNAITKLDDDYVDNTLYPILFSTISLKSIDGANITGLNLYDNMDIIEPYLEFNDIIELIIRGICVNFMGALFDIILKFKVKKI